MGVSLYHSSKFCNHEGTFRHRKEAVRVCNIPVSVVARNGSSSRGLGRIHTRIPECDSRMRFKKVSRFIRSAFSSPHSPHFCSHSPTLGRASIIGQFNLVLSFNVKMDEAEVLEVWYLARKANKKCNRKLWAHPINQGRGEKGAYTLLYKELTDDCTEFFNYFISIICITIIPQCGMHLHHRNEFITVKTLFSILKYR